MTKFQIALSLGAIALIILLYQLPRGVVENDTLVSPEQATHTITIPEEVTVKLKYFRSSWESEENSEKKLNFADSLAATYLDFQVLDSGVWFVDYIKSTNSKGRELRIADLLYKGFQRSTDGEQARELGKRAGNEFRSLLEIDPDNSSLKNKLAMTLVTTENPMQGIQMLRDLLEEDPNDTETIKNLGILSIQSGQFAKAEERFARLLELDSTDLEAQFYFAMSQIEQGNEDGRVIMEQLSRNDVNSAIRSLATGYLEN